MKTTFLLGIGSIACCVLAVGCDTTAAKKVEEKSKDGVQAVKSATKEGVKEVKEAAAGAVDKAKEAVVKPMQDLLPKIEDKIKGMSGDVKTKASEKLEEVKKLLEEAKTAAPDKWETLKSKLATAFDELKKLVGV